MYFCSGQPMHYCSGVDTHRHRDTFDGHQILDSMRKAVKRPHQLPAGKLCVAFPRLRQQARAILESDYGVHFWVQFLDVVEVGGHDIDAGGLPRTDHGCEHNGVHHDNLGRESTGGNRLRN